MRLGQIRSDGATVAALFEGEQAYPIPAHTMCDLIRRAEAESVPLITLARNLASRHASAALPIIPLHPSEVWACGCTYEQSAAFRDAELGSREKQYDAVYRAERPEIFFKGTGRVCVGPGKPIGIRQDSHFTAPEPELAIILGTNGHILGYTIANDVSAWDIERTNTLYLPQAKIYKGSCALGPVIVTADSLSDPYSLEIACNIERAGRKIFEGSVSTAKLNRRFETVLEFLVRSNPVPSASVLLTGTGIIVTEEAALAPGDVVRISIPEIGELSNTVERV